MLLMSGKMFETSCSFKCMLYVTQSFTTQAFTSDHRDVLH